MDQLHTRFDALAPQTEDRPSSPHPVGRRRWWPLLVGGVTVLVIWLGSSTSVHAQDITCGSILGPGGRYVLQNDLECPEHAVTVRDRALLDLNGHIITCAPDSYRCVVLTGEGARLRNGVVQGTFFLSIVLEGTGGHTVRDVTSTLVDGNIWVFSDRNVLINVTAMSANSAAIYIGGNRNRLQDSVAECPHALNACIEVEGNGNRLINNVAMNGSGHKILVTGHGNVLRGNEALFPLDGPPDQFGGIFVTGMGNRFQDNTAMGNLIDLVDAWGDCTHNIWRRNTFETSDPACIGGDAVAAPVAQLAQ